ncbi:hypothetical protein BJV82DRAFT_367935 [Fennellomyces sp. T-0311]|nr:hypothetical protein BJV82DRAFT_367935 [Fennellomyces sp. T-0311]
MLVARKKGYGLTAIEWKRKTIDDKQLLLQQCKSIRVNKCTLSAIWNLPILPENALDHYVLGMDWRGFCGYMFIVKKIHGIYIAKKKNGSDMWLPTHLKLVSRFKETLQLLLFWKNHLNTLCQMIDVAIAVKDSAGMESIAGAATLKRQSSDSDFTYMSPKRSR